MNYCKKLEEIRLLLEAWIGSSRIIERQDIFTFNTTAGESMYLTEFNEINLVVISGEFKLSNVTHDMHNTTGVSISSGSLNTYIVLSSDGSVAGTSITDTSKGWNSGRISTTNSYLIECVSADGAIQIDVRKD